MFANEDLSWMDLDPYTLPHDLDISVGPLALVESSHDRGTIHVEDVEDEDLDDYDMTRFIEFRV
jgi:hypothetical protein